MYELIRVGNDKLIGEIIRLEGDSATIQVPATALVLEQDLTLRWLLFAYAVTCAGPAPFQTCVQTSGSGVAVQPATEHTSAVCCNPVPGVAALGQAEAELGQFGSAGRAPEQLSPKYSIVLLRWLLMCQHVAG